MNITCAPLGAYQANCYLIADEETKTCGLIDPGDQPDAVEDLLAKSGCELAFIALTHGHMDHMGAIESLLSSRPDVPVYVHPGDVLPGGSSLFPTIQATNIKPISDGDTISIGSRQLKAIHTPGHSIGSTTYQLEDILFTGDTLFKGTMGRCDFQGGDYGTLIASLKKLGTMDGDFQICAGHEAHSTMEYERKFNHYMLEALGG